MNIALQKSVSPSFLSKQLIFCFCLYHPTRPLLSFSVVQELCKYNTRFSHSGRWLLNIGCWVSSLQYLCPFALQMIPAYPISYSLCDRFSISSCLSTERFCANLNYVKVSNYPKREQPGLAT